MRPIVWLASYPKCGNTWVRLLLANLGRDEAVTLNAMPMIGGIASGRARFDTAYLFASSLLTHDECDRLRPSLYRDLAVSGEVEVESDAHPAPLQRYRFLKTHDAWSLTDRGEPLLAGRDAARGAILIVRDPRDVAASLANHMGKPLDEAIAFMGDPDACFAGSTNRQHNQLRQVLRGWSGYNRSWLGQDELPVHLLRYEDLQTDPAKALGQALEFVGLSLPPGQLAQSARLSQFARLQEQESRHGFREAPVKTATGSFFRRGISGGWRDELTEAQRLKIEADHGEMMLCCGYEPLGTA